jgi:hypothetical protein
MISQVEYRPLQSFAFICHHNERDGYWYCVVMIRRRGLDGELTATHSDLSWPLAHRLAEKLCDRYAIQDRGGLMCGSIITVG